MAEGPPFPKKETEIFKVSCESRANTRASANDVSGPLIIMSPPSSNLSSSTLLPQLISDQHLQANPSSILIPNPNPNSIGSPNPSTANASPSFRSAYNSVTNPLYYHANHERIGSCRFRKAEQSSIRPIIASSGLAEKGPITFSQPMKEHQAGDHLEPPGTENEMMIGQCGLLAAHAYSPWFMSWPDDRYQVAAESTDMAYRVRSIYEEYPTAGSAQAAVLGVNQAFSSGSGPTSPPSHVDDPAAPSSPSSSASELHNTSGVTGVDDISTHTPLPASDVAVHETTDEGVEASQARATMDSNPPLKKQRRKGQKRVREARVALLTKSEVEHLEDGYRWRKYGQKAVKNSPHPRSYYRCTNSKCSVKKRVERCTEDPSLVVTTYEGQHTHHSPALLRGSILPDPNYPLSTATHVSFVPWQSSPINPSLHFTSTLAHSQLIRNPFLSPANVLYGFPQMSTPLSFPSLVHHLPITGALARDNAEKTLIVQGECVQGNVNKSKHTDFMQEIEASEHQHHHQRRFSHGRTPHAASATVESTPLIDKGLLDDMLPHRPCMRNTSPPTPSP